MPPRLPNIEGPFDFKPGKGKAKPKLDVKGQPIVGTNTSSPIEAPKPLTQYGPVDEPSMMRLDKQRASEGAAMGRPIDARANTAMAESRQLQERAIAPDVLTAYKPVEAPKAKSTLEENLNALEEAGNRPGTGNPQLKNPIAGPAKPAEVFDFKEPSLEEAAKLEREAPLGVERELAGKEQPTPIESPKTEATREAEQRKRNTEVNEKLKGKAKDIGKVALGGAAAITALGIGSKLLDDSGSGAGGPTSTSKNAGESGSAPVETGKTQEQIAKEQADAEAAAKLKADNTPDARLPGGGKSFMANEGPFELSGGQKGKYAENVRRGAGGQSMPETGQQLIDRLRAESGDTIAVRSKKAVEQPEQDRIAREARVKEEKEAISKMSPDERRLHQLSKQTNWTKASNDEAKAIRSRMAAAEVNPEVIKARAEMKKAESMSGVASEAIQANRDVGMAQAGAMAGQTAIKNEGVKNDSAKVAIAQQKQNLAEFLKLKQDNAASYGPRLQEIANTFSNHFFTRNAPEQTALNFDNTAPTPGEIEAGLSEAFAVGQNPTMENDYSHALAIAGLPDTVAHRALLAIRLARAGKKLNTADGRKFVENKFH